jgi:hypothetical protein
MANEKHFVSSSDKRLTLDSIDVENPEELRALIKQVLRTGDAIAKADWDAMIREGIIDSRGNLLKTDPPEDMREGVTRDFGG